MKIPKHIAEQHTFPGIDLDSRTELPVGWAAKDSAKKTFDETNAPNLGKVLKVLVPDFADPKRPKTCLEVDFPLVPVNAIAKVETSSGPARKRVYCMSKWWARRASTVFRAMLLAAATQAPIRKQADGSPVLDPDGIPVPDETEAAKAVWDIYYANHQKAGNFKDLKVLDCFMGGGTTLVEGSRLGFQVVGVDLNPVAWFVVKNELACTNPDEVRQFFDQIDSEVKPLIQPFYVAECQRGHTGRWYQTSVTGYPTEDRRMPEGFDPLTLSVAERSQYRYEGPELIYTFWAKHGVCSQPGCGHRTPIFRSPVIAEKKLGVKYVELTCKSCKTIFHAELGAARMAPGAERVVLGSEFAFTELSQPFAKRMADYSKGDIAEKRARINELNEMVHSEPGLMCPECGEFSGQYLRDILNQHLSAKRLSEIDKKHLNIQPPRNGTKHVYSYLMVDPEWLKGTPGIINGNELGGYADAPAEATSLWYRKRLENLRLIEVRGRIRLTEDTSGPTDSHSDAMIEAEDDLPEVVTEPNNESDENDRKLFGLPRFVMFADGRRIDTRRGTVPQKSHFTCGQCGKKQDARKSIEQFAHTAPVAVSATQCFCPQCEAEGYTYGGRYFASLADKGAERLTAAEREWCTRRDGDLAGYWPTEEIPHSYMTHHANFALPKQGYTHWWKMFNSRQLLVHAQFLRAITASPQEYQRKASKDVRLQALGAWQEFSRHQCMFSFWDIQQDCLAPLFANPNYTPKNGVVENNQFLAIGRENWRSCRQGVINGLEWCRQPTELVVKFETNKGKTEKAPTGDPVLPGAEILCRSSSDLSSYASRSFDLVITDPPFGDNIFYSDLANFFHAWLRLSLRHEYPELFKPTQTPNAQEALAPRLLQEQEANEYYRVRLTACWAEACRLLKDGGILAFTFHHSEDSQWAVVLESLFEAGFILEQTFPISSDDMKGESGQFGAKGTEYDIIHVCRKRLAEPTAVSWAKLRQWVKAELNRLKVLLAAYRASELSDADIRVILRGKALEFYSRHYGQVFTSDDEPLSIRHALGGINQLLDEGTADATGNPPSIVQPVAYQYLRLFTLKPTRTADDVSKSLFGTALRQRDFEDRGWVEERNRLVTSIPIPQRFQDFRKRPRKEMKTEIDQAHFLIGAARPDSGVNLEQELSKDTWMVRRSVDAVLEWYAKMSPDPELRSASTLARTILRQTLDKLRQQPTELERQLSLFNDWDESE